MHSISETVFVHAVFFFSLNQWHPEQVKKKKKRERKREKEELNIVFIVLQCKLKISNHLANLLPNGVLAVTSHTNCMLGGGWRKKKKHRGRLLRISISMFCPLWSLKIFIIATSPGCSNIFYDVSYQLTSVSQQTLLCSSVSGEIGYFCQLEISKLFN